MEKGSITVDGISLTVVDVGAGVLHRQPDPRDPGPHHPGLQATRRRRQPRGGRDREVRREDGETRMTEPTVQGTIRLDRVEEAIADIAAGKAVVVVDDEDRENEGDIIFAASKATPELMAFTIRHSQRGDLRADAGRHARPARDPADDAAQQGQAADGVHDLRRRPRRRHHRHLRRRPCAHRARAGRLGERAVGRHPAGPRVPAALPRGRRARTTRPHRGGGRPRPDGRPHPGRRARRGRQRRRHHEARPASCATSPTSTA